MNEYYRNKEQYADRTAGAALSRIDAEERRSHAAGRRVLERYGKCLAGIQAMDIKIEALETVAQKMTPQTHLQPGTVTPDIRKNEEILIRLAELQKRRDAEISRSGDLLLETMALIDSLPDDRLKTILTLRYIRRMNWDEIADATFISKSRLYELHGHGLEAVEKSVADRSSPYLNVVA